MKTDAKTNWIHKITPYFSGVIFLAALFVLHHTLKKYRLERIAENISCDVLLTSSANDSLLNPDEMWKLKKHLINAKSVTTIALTEKDGAHVHCAFDIADNFQAQMFDWIENKFNK